MEDLKNLEKIRENILRWIRYFGKDNTEQLPSYQESLSDVDKKIGAYSGNSGDSTKTKKEKPENKTKTKTKKK